MHLAFHGEAAKLIGASVAEGPLDPGTSEKHRVASDVVVAAIVIALGCREAAELRPKEFQSVFKQSALAQVSEQRGSRLIDVPALIDEPIMAILLAATLRGVAEDTGSRGSDVGIVGGTVEDATGAIIPKAELTLKCPLPCSAQTPVASNTGGFEFRNLARIGKIPARHVGH